MNTRILLQRTSLWPATLIVMLLVTGCGGAVGSTAAPTRTAPTLTATPSSTVPPTIPTAPSTPTAPPAIPTPPPPATALATATPSRTAGQPSGSPTGTLPPPGGAQVTSPAISAAIADLARRRNVEPGRITPLGAQVVEWPDGSLGCPEAGRSYIAVITPGWRIVLQLDGQTIVYHTDATGRMLTPCPRT